MRGIGDGVLSVERDFVGPTPRAFFLDRDVTQASLKSSFLEQDSNCLSARIKMRNERVEERGGEGGAGRQAERKKRKREKIDL